MLEVLCRLAFNKFLDEKIRIVETPVEAVQMAFENHFLFHFNDFDCNKWREEKLWNEDFDLLFTRLGEAGFKKVFEKYSGRYAPPG